MGWLKKITKNVKKKGFKALSLGQITGGDRAKLSAKREAAALLVPDPELEALKAEATAQADMPSIDSAAVEEARKKAMLLAAARGGRASTMLSDKGY